MTGLLRVAMVLVAVLGSGVASSPDVLGSDRFGHPWRGQHFVPIPGCYGTLNDITVGGLNGILRSSRLVGLEIIGGVPMNHFRSSCLSETRLGIPPYPPLARLNVFSDIYVRPGRPNQFERWLQFGDGVGLDPQQDEWFFLQEHNRRPDPIELPFLCKVLAIPVVQEPCSNLAPPAEDFASTSP
jgi:hypothetical protein